jgi:nucleoside-diphosphate-sugar epimerase
VDLRKKKIIVTGGAGFLGRHVVARLQQDGCKHVFVPRSAQYDLTHEADIRRLLTQQQPDVILHLAALVGGIGANRVNPGTFLYKNLIMGAQLIELSREFGVEKFVQIGTICCYPKFTPVPFKESDLWNGYPEETNAPYGLAKKLLIVQLQAYRQQFQFAGLNLLVVNLYGDPVNVGSGHEIAVGHLAEMIAKKVGFTGQIHYDASKPDGQPRRCLDVTLAKKLFGFEATTSLPDGLDRTIAWYRTQHDTRQPHAA